MSQEEINKDYGDRIRKLEEFILVNLNKLLDLTTDHKTRIEDLEAGEVAFKSFINDTCTLKDREIIKAKEDAISISCTHADNNHRQTWGVIAFIVTTIIGCIVYFNIENNKRALDIQKHETHIENIGKTLEKIDGKMDKIYTHVQSEAEDK